MSSSKSHLKKVVLCISICWEEFLFSWDTTNTSYLQKHQSTTKKLQFLGQIGPNTLPSTFLKVPKAVQYIMKYLWIWYNIDKNLKKANFKCTVLWILQNFRVWYCFLGWFTRSSCQNHAKPRTTIFLLKLKSSLQLNDANYVKYRQNTMTTVVFVKPILELFLFERHERIYHVNIANGSIPLYLIVRIF